MFSCSHPMVTMTSISSMFQVLFGDIIHRDPKFCNLSHYSCGITYPYCFSQYWIWVISFTRCSVLLWSLIFNFYHYNNNIIIYICYHYTMISPDFFVYTMISPYIYIHSTFSQKPPAPTHRAMAQVLASREPLPRTLLLPPPALDAMLGLESGDWASCHQWIKDINGS